MSCKGYCSILYFCFRNHFGKVNSNIQEGSNVQYEDIDNYVQSTSVGEDNVYQHVYEDVNEYSPHKLNTTRRMRSTNRGFFVPAGDGLEKETNHAISRISNIYAEPVTNIDDEIFDLPVSRHDRKHSSCQSKRISNPYDEPNLHKPNIKPKQRNKQLQTLSELGIEVKYKEDTGLAREGPTLIPIKYTKSQRIKQFDVDDEVLIVENELYGQSTSANDMPQMDLGERILNRSNNYGVYIQNPRHIGTDQELIQNELYHSYNQENTRL